MKSENRPKFLCKEIYSHLMNRSHVEFYTRVYYQYQNTKISPYPLILRSTSSFTHASQIRHVKYQIGSLIGI
jgi:hypothetical protein